MTKNFYCINTIKNEFETFLALKLSKSDKKKMSKYRNFNSNFLPCVDINNKGKYFVYGLGWKTINNNNKAEIPHYNKDVDNIKEYADKYGIDCLYYSLTGNDYRKSNCCTLPMQCELRSMLMAENADDYFEFVDIINKIRKIQTDTIKNDENLTETEIESYLRFCLIEPYFSYFESVKPYINEDELYDSLFKYFVNKRRNKLKKRYRYNWDFEDILIEDCFSKFPNYLKGRIYYLFGKECADLYEKAISYMKKF